MRTLLLAFAALATLPATAAPRDPFAPIGDADVSCFGRPPLQRVPLAALAVQGVVANTAAPRALVKLPDGSVHLVRIGDGLGPNLGRVVAITPAGVVVAEAFRDPLTSKTEAQRTVLAVRGGR